MGISCSHSNLIINNDTIMPTLNMPKYIDPTNTWSFIVADCKCADCGIIDRAIKKTCIDHKIEQSWVLVTKQECTHDYLKPYDYKYDPVDNTLRGRIGCVICKTSIPAIAEFITEYDANHKPILVIAKKWSTDRNRFLNELAKKRENKTM